MEWFETIYNDLIANYSAWTRWLIVIAIVTYGIQLWYYAGRYGRIASYRSRKPYGSPTPPPVSIIVVVEEDYAFLEGALPDLLEQEYTQFEVVLVTIDTSEEYNDQLTLLSARYPHLKTTRMTRPANYALNNKLALNVGIKAAQYEHLLFTTTESRPGSRQWLALMARGFCAGDVVLGYCGVERTRGFSGGIMRTTNLWSAIRSLSSAIRGVPYAGSRHNIGYTKSLYFGAKGFNHLNMNIGEDDLFIQRIATRYNTNIILSPNATVREDRQGGLGWWQRRRKFRTYGYKFYPTAVKNGIRWELFSRLLFYTAAVILLATAPMEIQIGVGVLIVTRLFIVEFEMWRIRKRLGEGGLFWPIMLYDVIGPFTEFGLWLSRNLKPVPGIWR